MSVSVLFRKDLGSEEEFKTCSDLFPTFEYRNQLPHNSLVIGRYSVLPFYNELEEDLKLHGSNLVNSYKQHRYIADFQYYEDLKLYTPKTYFQFHEIDEEGPFVVKGKTNSRKLEWNKKMFVQTKAEAVNLGLDLMNDGLIAQQGVVVRKFVELIKLDEGLNGLPITNEWRFFYYQGNRLAYDFYWTQFSDAAGQMDTEGLSFANKVASIVKDKVNFVVIDIAQKLDGSWILIELNDGQMSGLSGVKPEDLYRKLKEHV